MICQPTFTSLQRLNIVKPLPEVNHLGVTERAPGVGALAQAPGKTLSVLRGHGQGAPVFGLTWGIDIPTFANFLSDFFWDR